MIGSFSTLFFFNLIICCHWLSTGSSYILSRMCPITINLPCVLLLFCERFLRGSTQSNLQAARSGFCRSGFVERSEFLRSTSESVGSSYPDPTKTITRARLSYPAEQKPDRVACRSIEPGRNRSQNKSKTQGKFIVLSIY